MTVLPSPIPHPLDFCPWDLPGWAYEALEWVVGFDWPEGNEKTTWDLADQWYDLAGAIVTPRDDAAEAAQVIIDAYGGSGTTIEAFIAAWNKVANGSDAPLNALVEFATEMGKMVEGCGQDIESAKLEAWIELGIFVIELVGMAVTVALTLGAASPAAGGLIAATRMAIQQIFKRLVAQLAKKAIKQGLKDMGKRIAKDLITKQGLKKLGKHALKEAREEAREEFLTNAGITAYQTATGRNKLDWGDLADLGIATGAGAAGGFAAHGGNIGAGKRSGLFRGAASEVLGDLGGNAATGNLSDFDSLAKSATSGATGSAIGNTHHDFKGMNADLVGDLSLSDLPSTSSTPGSSTPVNSALPDVSGGPSPGVSHAAASGGHDGGSSAGGPSHVASSSGSGGGHAASVAGTSHAAAASVVDAGQGASSSGAGAGHGASPGAGAGHGASSGAGAGHGSSPVVDAGHAAASPVAGHAAVAGSGTVYTSTHSDATLASAAPTVDAPTHSGATALSPTSFSGGQSAPVNVAPTSVDNSTVAAPSLTGAGPAAAPSITSAGPAITPNPNVSLATGNPSGMGPTPATGGPSISPAALTTASPSVANPHSTGPAVGNPAIPAPRSDASPATSAPSTSAPSTSAPSTSAPSTSAPTTPGGPAHPSNPTPTPPSHPNRHDPRTQPTTTPPTTDRPNPDPDYNDAFTAAGPTHSRPHLTSRTPEQARAESMYFDGYNRKKQAVLNDVYHREIGPINREIAHYQREQERSRRAARRSRLLLNFRGADHHRHMEALYQRKEAEATVRRDQTWADLQQLDLRTLPDWSRANTDDGRLSDQPIFSGDRSALSGSGNPPNARTLRKYYVPGGLRVPLEMHQADLERAVPRDRNGVPVRTPDPRGAYVQLLNDGGPTADPTRGVNCLDCSLAFFETYVHGRPTVSAPRTVDTYTNGGTDLHVGETDGHFRAEDATGSAFTQVSPNVSHKAPADAKADIDNAFAAVARTLLQGGHGSTAIIINQWEGQNGHGGWHAWNAVNHNGTLYFIDPQTGGVVDATNFGGGPGHRTLYGHSGTPDGANVVTVNALMVDGQGHPMAVPNTPPAPYHSKRPIPPPPPAHQQQQAPPHPSPPAPAVNTPAPATRVEPPTVEPPRDGSARTPQTRPGPAPEPPPSDPLTVLEPQSRKAHNDPLSALDPTRDGDAREVAERRGRENYDYANHRVRHDYAETHRQALGRDLRDQARARESRAEDLTDAIRAADRDGDLAAVDRHRAARDRALEDAYELRAQARAAENGGVIGDVELTGHEWDRVNEVDGGNDLAPGPVATGDRSALTGDHGPRPVDTTRPYHVRGGLRPPLAIHQTDLERAVPRDEHGNPLRHADPRDGNWFGLQNDGGPEADPTRSNNCGDTVLSFYDTWMHGRPRVSAPRTFDGYHHGDPNHPIGAERGVTTRIENTTGGRFEGLADVNPTTTDPQTARDEVRLAQSRLHHHLLGLGHGSMAFITTQDQAGRTHEVAAVNQNGTILYLDPQNRTLNDRHPIPTHTGNGFPSDVVRIDALTVDGQARPQPLETGRPPSITTDPSGVGVNPDAYTAAQLEQMHQHGGELGLTREQIDDFVKTGSIEKPANPPKRMEPKTALTPDQVMQQMDNWANEVEPRGYPYLFASREQFDTFVARLGELHETYGLPHGRVLVQGSALRTPHAGDVDVAVIASDEEFDAYVARCEAGIEQRASARAKERVLQKLADNVSKGFVSSFYIDRPSEATPGFGKALHPLLEEFSLPDIDFSVMRESSVLMMHPWMEIPVGRA